MKTAEQYCIAAPGTILAVDALSLVPAITSPVPGESANIFLRILATPCGETNLTAQSLSLADAQSLQSTVCGEMQFYARVAPQVCGINVIRTGSILVGMSVVLPPGADLDFEPFAPWLQTMLQRLLGLQLEVTVDGAAAPTTQVPSTASFTSSMVGSSTSSS
jgi:hypothetical protein